VGLEIICREDGKTDRNVYFPSYRLTGIADATLNAVAGAAFLMGLEIICREDGKEHLLPVFPACYLLATTVFVNGQWSVSQLHGFDK
jgi:hypothetical protein